MGACHDDEEGFLILIAFFVSDGVGAAGGLVQAVHILGDQREMR